MKFLLIIWMTDLKRGFESFHFFTYFFNPNQPKWNVRETFSEKAAVGATIQI